MQGVRKSISKKSPRRPKPRFIPGSAIQFFILKVDSFVGTQLFGAEVPIVIGRHYKSAIRLEDETVSRVHCRVFLDGEQIYIEDNNSGNGTLVNSNPVTGRHPVQPTDAIQIGDYTLKVRALIPSTSLGARPRSGISERPTKKRRKAPIPQPPKSRKESGLVEVDAHVDQRLFEAALRRATGAEQPKTPIPLVVMEGGRSAEHVEDSAVETEATRRDDSLMCQLEEATEPPTNRSFEIDPMLDQKIGELERLVNALQESPSDSSEHPCVISPTDEILGSWVDVPKKELPKANKTEPKNSGSPNAQKDEVVQRVSQAELKRPVRTAIVRARRTIVKSPVPMAIRAQKQAPVTDQIRARNPNKKRDISALRVTPVSVISGLSKATEKMSAMPCSVNGSSNQSQRAKDSGRVRRLPARLVTPTDSLRSVPSNALSSRNQSSSRVSIISEDDIIEARRARSFPYAVSEPTAFRAVEITSRQNGRLVDIAMLSENGQQYVLGYPTPQGAKAPSCGHMGLRLVRINKNRSVDLVFPREAGGQLTRDSETVRFADLTQGRKYSSVRLLPRDQVELTLCNKGKTVTYQVRFLQNPKL